ncbi:MAG: Mov34/MPN/PAD-1 family protein [Candidatus Helarchaeota archaeon]|nr:Mov34/MPN/PAD-1 family protein [Candidatus Helarchaeota archaeon]
MDSIILHKSAYEKIKSVSKSIFEKEKKEVIGYLIGYLHEASVEIKDIVFPEQTGNRTYVEVEEEVSLVNTLIKAEDQGTNEICVGWYHSHPGFRCFLSATDIETQIHWQKVNPRNIALVYDPVHSEIKAFRIAIQDDAFKQIDISLKVQG